MPEKIHQVLNLFPSMPCIDVIFLEHTWVKASRWLRSSEVLVMGLSLLIDSTLHNRVCKPSLSNTELNSIVLIQNSEPEVLNSSNYLIVDWFKFYNASHNSVLAPVKFVPLSERITETWPLPLMNQHIELTHVSREGATSKWMTLIVRQVKITTFKS